MLSWQLLNLYLCSKWPQWGTCDGILDVWISYDKILRKKYKVNLEGLLASNYCYCTRIIAGVCTCASSLHSVWHILLFFCKGHKRHQYCKYLYIFGLRKTDSRLPHSILGNLYVNFFNTLEKKMRIRVS